jgi:hypothetical protein
VLNAIAIFEGGKKAAGIWKGEPEYKIYNTRLINLTGEKRG